MVNMTDPHPGLRAIFQDVRFRRALSLAINREEMNDIAYYGQGVPRQLTVVPTSRYFEPEFATAWARYDPLRSVARLDEMEALPTVTVTAEGNDPTANLWKSPWRTPVEKHPSRSAGFCRASAPGLG